MRKILIIAALASLTMAPMAFAGHNGSQSAYTVAHEKGVTVYRGHIAQPNYQAITHRRALTQQAQQKAEALALHNKQQQALAAQIKTLQALEGRINTLEHTRQRPRTRSRYGYGRSYYGNPRFFGTNGFIGNSNFSGATIQLGGHSYRPRYRHQKRRMVRKRHY